MSGEPADIPLSSGNAGSGRSSAPPAPHRRPSRRGVEPGLQRAQSHRRRPDLLHSSDPLVAADTDGKKDVYEWEPPGMGNCEADSPTFDPAGVCLGLISAGTSAFDSGLLGVDAPARDAYFFTRDSLVPQDENGPTMKIYDAREEGGFPFLFPPVACRASDECHGAASPAPGPLKSAANGHPTQLHRLQEALRPQARSVRPKAQHPQTPQRANTTSEVGGEFSTSSGRRGSVSRSRSRRPAGP